ncbi:hypothetical protein ACFXCZ_27050 [Streptomyces sp. NPDC059396]|uniref:hypothetical protein n=1 Tax=Streptomyces sp. NPDC059396 TaxID=3346819 RepID=UPI0036B876AB
MLSSVTEMVDPNTSGWTAMLNATLSKGTGGRNGDGCLVIKSVAAGEMRARTVSSYPVSEGIVYQTFADAAGATVPERIGIRWLTAANTEISYTWSLVTATASASWHRIGVAGPAPAGAVRAQVVVSSTPAAAAVVTFVENVYLGEPIRTTGNLLPFNAESFEIDTSEWMPGTNGSLSRQAPAVTWPVDYYTAGGEVLALTVNTAGSPAARTVNRQVVTPGVEYVASCYLNPPTAGSDAGIELRFHDAAGTQIQATRGALAAPGTGWYRQQVSAVAPPNAVTCSLAVGLVGALVGQVLRIEHAVITVAAPLLSGSVVPLDAASFEQGTGGWAVASGAATLARSTPWGAVAFTGSYALTVTSASTTTSVITSPVFPIGDAAGQTWATAYPMAVTAGGWTIARAVHWYDAAGASIQTDTATVTPIPSPGWWILSAVAPAPAGAARLAIELTLTATAPASVLRIDRVTVVQSLPQTETSVSETTASARLTMRDLNTALTLTVWRVTSDGARSLVRGPSGLIQAAPIPSDLMVLEDYEAPLGVPYSYYAEARDPASGALLQTRESQTLTIPHRDVNTAWIKDPGNPQRNARVMVEAQPDWTRPVDQAQYVVKGRRNKVVLSGARNGREGSLVIWTTSDEEREGFHWLLDSGAVLLWQTGPGVGAGNMYVNIGEVSESRGNQSADDPFRTWTLPLTEADMPVTTGVNGSAGRTWQDILSEFATWAEVRDTFATWEDVLLNRRQERQE